MEYVSFAKIQLYTTYGYNLMRSTEELSTTMVLTLAT